jgi:hypothetical protein
LNLFVECWVQISPKLPTRHFHLTVLLSVQTIGCILSIFQKYSKKLNISKTCLSSFLSSLTWQFWGFWCGVVIYPCLCFLILFASRELPSLIHSNYSVSAICLLYFTYISTVLLKAFIISQMDSCNYLLNGVPASLLLLTLCLL